MLFIRRVVGKSMQPSFRQNTIVIALRRKSARLGDVVIAKKDGTELIKRVASKSERGYYLLGDNPSGSTDSRQYGWFAPRTITAVVIGRLR